MGAIGIPPPVTFPLALRGGSASSDRMDSRPDHPSAVTEVATASHQLSAGFCWSLVLLLLLGVALRLGHIEHDFYHMDEKIAQAVVKNLSFPQQWDTNWAKTDLSPESGFHYDQFNFSSYHILLYFWKCLVSALGVDWVNHPGALRALNGLLGLISIWAVALAVRQIAGEIAGIAAAGAGAIMPLWVEDAHYLRCESMLTAGVAILLWLSTRRDSTNRWVLFSSCLIVGWMMACKATTGLAAPLLLIILINAANRPLGRQQSLLIPLGIAGLGLVVGVVLGVPGGVAQPQLYLSGLARLAVQYRSPLPPFTRPDMAPSLGVTLEYMKGTLGLGLWAVAVLGVGSMIKLAGWWRTGLLLSPLAAALLVFGGHAFFAERSYSPFLPIAIVFFGAGIQLLVRTIMRRFGPKRSYHAAILTAFLLTVTLALPMIYSWQLVFRVFSGQERLEEKKAIVRMKGDLSGQIVSMDQMAYYPDNYRSISAAVEAKEPVLVIVLDYNEPYSGSCLITLQNRFNGRILGVRESIFPNLPPCFLTTFISPKLWLIYIPSK